MILHYFLSDLIFEINTEVKKKNLPQFCGKEDVISYNS